MGEREILRPGRLLRRGRARDGHAAHCDRDGDHAGRRRELRPRDVRRVHPPALRRRRACSSASTASLKRRPRLLRPVAELAVGEHAAARGRRPGRPRGTCRPRRSGRRCAASCGAPVQCGCLRVAQLEREAPVVRVHAPPARAARRRARGTAPSSPRRASRERRASARAARGRAPGDRRADRA